MVFTQESPARYRMALRGSNSEAECLVANEDVEIAKFSCRTTFESVPIVAISAAF